MSPSEITPTVGTAVDGPGRVEPLRGNHREQPAKPKQQDAVSPGGTGSDTVSLSAEALTMSQGTSQKETEETATLARTEEKVKAHEAAHKAAGGQFAGSATYQYRIGPDGKNYITGGEVSIDMSPGKTPEETIAKMEMVIRAALAPADPSPQDRAVAAQAAALMAEAQREAGRGTSPETTDAARNGGRDETSGAMETAKQDGPSPLPEISTYV